MPVSVDTTLSDQVSDLKLQGYDSILIGVDASDHSTRAVKDALNLAEIWGAKVTGAHVYAARLHDARFRQMEGGLPEKYQEEEELEKQRDVHDDLITKGLSVITDSYLDQVEAGCRERDIAYQRCSLEGKNYVQLVNEANSGGYDLLVLGSLGLGAVQSSRIGTVCERVVRRSVVDTLVIKNPARPIVQGPIVVAVDGSALSYGGLLTGYSLARELSIPLHVISAYDPYYHYVAFNRIAGVLSEEAGKVFRFKEQEQLHEDIIDAGLAKIYQGHLEVAQSLADELDIELSTRLLDGKPYEVIQQYLSEVDAGLLIVGKTGIHADAGLDIGGQAENLLRNVDCAVLLSHREYTPPTETLAQATTSWTRQAEERMQGIPEFVRGMARLGILRYAQEQGHTVITGSIVAEATADLCPVSMGGQEQTGRASRLVWSEAATTLLETVDNQTLRDAIRLKAEKKARQAMSDSVEADHVKGFISLEQQPEESQCPFSDASTDTDKADPGPEWTRDALDRLARVPEGFMRDMTQTRIEEFAAAHHYQTVTLEVMEEKYSQWGRGSEVQAQRLAWQADAKERLERIPLFVRGMVMKEVEALAIERGAETVTAGIMEEASRSWESSMKFHSDR